MEIWQINEWYYIAFFGAAWIIALIQQYKGN